MLRQRSILALARLLETCFTTSYVADKGRVHFVRTDEFADLLFEFEYPKELIEFARKLTTHPGAIKTFVLQMWDGFPTALLPEPASRRNDWFKQLCAHALEHCDRRFKGPILNTATIAQKELIASLELDGYCWRDGKLLQVEEQAFDVPAAESVLVKLCDEPGLAGFAQVKKELKDLDDQYVAEKWGDSIKHARDLLEVVLVGIARTWFLTKGVTFNEQQLKQARWIRDQLLRTGFFQEKEHDFIRALYALLSEQGGHPNMSQRDSAFICRQYVLSATHFLLERLKASRPVLSRPPPK